MKPPSIILLVSLAVSSAFKTNIQWEKNQGGDEFVLFDDHVVNIWRKELGLVDPGMKKVAHWVRNEQIGIGNTLGGFAAVTISGLIENRTVVYNSRMLEKFCALVSCKLKKLPGGSYAPHKGTDVTIAGHSGIRVSGGPEMKPEMASLAPFYHQAGCSLGETLLANFDSSKDKVDEWPRRCLYSQLLRSLIVGKGGRLSAESDWLQE